MKILHICAVGFTVKNLLLPQINFFLNKGFIVEVACSPSDEVQELQRQGYTIHPIHIDRKINLQSNIKSILQLRNLIANHQYDLVHVHTPVASVLGRVAAKLAHSPRIIYTAHGFYFHDNMAKRQYFFYHTVEKVAGWLTDLILTQSQEDLETAKKTGLCSVRKLRYLGNGVDIEKFKPSTISLQLRESLKPDIKLPDCASPVLGMTGRITAEKGYKELIEALISLRSKFPQIHLIIIGGQLQSERDAFQSELSQLITQHNLNNHVTFTGFRSDIPNLLSLIDLFVLPSYREGLPRSILEAMAMRLPVVTTDIRGCREAVIDQKTGLIVPPKNSETLAIAIETILSNKNLKVTFGQASRQRAEENFDEQLVFQRLASAYQELGLVVS